MPRNPGHPRKGLRAKAWWRPKRKRLRARSRKEALNVRALAHLQEILGREWDELYGPVCACCCERRRQAWDHIAGREGTGPDGFPLKLDPTNLQPLANPCHEALTNAKDGVHTNHLYKSARFLIIAGVLKKVLVGMVGPGVVIRSRDVANAILKLQDVNTLKGPPPWR